MDIEADNRPPMRWTLRAPTGWTQPPTKREPGMTRTGQTVSRCGLEHQGARPPHRLPGASRGVLDWAALALADSRKPARGDGLGARAGSRAPSSPRAPRPECSSHLRAIPASDRQGRLSTRLGRGSDRGVQVVAGPVALWCPLMSPSPGRHRPPECPPPCPGGGRWCGSRRPSRCRPRGPRRRRE